MSTPAAPIQFDRAAFSGRVRQAFENARTAAQTDPAQRAALAQMMRTTIQVARRTEPGRESGLPEGPDWQLVGPEGATAAVRERLTADGRRIPEMLSLGPDDATASRQAAELLDRAPGQPVPGYGERPQPTATVDDRSTALDADVARGGLSTDSPIRAAEGGAAGRDPIGSRAPAQPSQDPRTR